MMPRVVVPLMVVGFAGEALLTALAWRRAPRLAMAGVAARWGSGLMVLAELVREGA
jgi:hypothetical protein